MAKQEVAKPNVADDPDTIEETGESKGKGFLVDSPRADKQLFFHKVSANLWHTHPYHEFEIIISQRGHFGKSRLTIKKDSVVGHKDTLDPSYR